MCASVDVKLPIVEVPQQGDTFTPSSIAPGGHGKAASRAGTDGKSPAQGHQPAFPAGCVAAFFLLSPRGPPLSPSVLRKAKHEGRQPGVEAASLLLSGLSLAVVSGCRSLSQPARVLDVRGATSNVGRECFRTVPPFTCTVVSVPHRVPFYSEALYQVPSSYRLGERQKVPLSCSHQIH